jgi:hypothetical protein
MVDPEEAETLPDSEVPIDPNAASVDVDGVGITFDDPARSEALESEALGISLVDDGQTSPDGDFRFLRPVHDDQIVDAIAETQTVYHESAPNEG